MTNAEDHDYNAAVEADPDLAAVYTYGTPTQKVSKESPGVQQRPRE